MAVVVLTLVLLTGCSTVRYVPVTEYRDRYVSRTDTMMQTDSVLVHDSVAVYMRGDTVFKDRVSYRDRLKYVYRTKADTVLVRDSIPYEVRVEVERKATLADKVRQSLYGIAAALVAVAAAWLALVLVRRMRNK